MNYKYILLLSSIIMFSNLSCMEHNELAEESQGLNLLPAQLVGILINNTFFESEETDFGQALENINWKNWTEEEIEIIGNILASEKAKSHTQIILITLQAIQLMGNQNYELKALKLFKDKLG
jgi:hypothetical protein